MAHYSAVIKVERQSTLHMLFVVVMVGLALFIEIPYPSEKLIFLGNG
jgi:hypothetical protein